MPKHWKTFSAVTYSRCLPFPFLLVEINVFLGKYRYGVLMFSLLGVVFAHWQQIHLQKTPRVSLEIMLYVKIILDLSQSPVGSGLLTVGMLIGSILDYSVVS